jgi:outer membrane protein assembly factor BamB
MKRTSRFCFSSLLLLLCLCVATLRADDWPRWRGPQGDGISRETGLLDSWPEKGPAELWRIPLGGGFSSIVVVGNQAFTMYSNEHDELIGAFDVVAGKQLWSVKTDELYKNDSYGDGPRATPTVDDNRIYTLSGRGTLDCRAIAGGKLLWTKNLLKDFGAELPEYGYSSSPVILGGKLIVVVGAQKGKSLAALDKTTGKVLWTSLDDKIGYATPIQVSTDGTAQIIDLMGEAVVGVSAEDGREFWRTEWKTTLNANVATPIAHDNKLFISSGYGTGCALFALSAPGGKPGIEKLWANKNMKNYFSTSVLLDGNLYGLSDTLLTCVDFEKGTSKWKEHGFNRGSLIAADGKLFVLTERGMLVLGNASPKEFKEISKVQLFGNRTWTVPTLSAGRLFVRDEKEMVCLKVK